MVILSCYTSSAFSEVIYVDFYAKILDWNFRLVDENSQILVIVFVSWISVLVFVSSTKTAEFRRRRLLWRKLIHFRQQKFFDKKNTAM